MQAVHLIIHGRVQGVGYRAWFYSNAKKRGLNGWVRNRMDGTVEAVIAGDKAVLDEMIAASHKGPLAAKVREVAVSPSEEMPEGLERRDTV